MAVFSANVQLAPFTLPFEQIRQAIGSYLSSSVAYEVQSSLFAINATLGEWQISRTGITITLASGTLIDLDKGSFPLAGLAVSLRPQGKMIPSGIAEPGSLSELQQAGLLDAIASYLNHPRLQYRVDSDGLHVTAGDRTFHFPQTEKLC